MSVDQDPSAQEKLLEESESLMHRMIAQFQMAQRKQFEDAIKEKGYKERFRIRDVLLEQRDRYIIHMETEKMWRDKAIKVFCLPHSV